MHECPGASAFTDHEIGMVRMMRNGILQEVCTSCGEGFFTRIEPVERATPHRLTGEHIVRERFGDERTDFGGPAGNYEQMVDDGRRGA